MKTGFPGHLFPPRIRLLSKDLCPHASLQSCLNRGGDHFDGGELVEVTQLDSRVRLHAANLAGSPRKD